MFIKLFDDLLINLRRQPEHVRKHYALNISIALTLLVLIIWLSTFSLESVGVSSADDAGNSSFIYSLYKNIVVGAGVIQDWIINTIQTIKNAF